MAARGSSSWQSSQHPLGVRAEVVWLVAAGAADGTCGTAAAAADAWQRRRHLAEAGLRRPHSTCWLDDLGERRRLLHARLVPGHLHVAASGLVAVVPGARPSLAGQRRQIEVRACVVLFAIDRTVPLARARLAVHASPAALGTAEDIRGDATGPREAAPGLRDRPARLLRIHVQRRHGLDAAHGVRKRQRGRLRLLRSLWIRLRQGCSREVRMLKHPGCGVALRWVPRQQVGHHVDGLGIRLRDEYLELGRYKLREAKANLRCQLVTLSPLLLRWRAAH
mmetsp:Transcript_97217/g.247256  ORF Transcript_97217/g.247256 Transcript_97217/m.247256 type:complete len:279 (-) Transcript_97217:642-1478(-)